MEADFSSVGKLNLKIKTKNCIKTSKTNVVTIAKYFAVLYLKGCEVFKTDRCF